MLSCSCFVKELREFYCNFFYNKLLRREKYYIYGINFILFYIYK